MALELCESIEEQAEKLKALVYIASTLEKAGRKKEATVILSRVYHEALALRDGEGKEALLTSLACAYARLGSRKEVDDILKRKEAHEAERDLQQEWLLVSLVQACARRGNVDEPLQVDTIPSKMALLYPVRCMAFPSGSTAPLPRALHGIEA